MWRCLYIFILEFKIIPFTTVITAESYLYLMSSAHRPCLCVQLLKFSRVLLMGIIITIAMTIHDIRKNNSKIFKLAKTPWFQQLGWQQENESRIKWNTSARRVKNNVYNINRWLYGDGVLMSLLHMTNSYHVPYFGKTILTELTNIKAKHRIQFLRGLFRLKPSRHHQVSNS